MTVSFLKYILLSFLNETKTSLDFHLRSFTGSTHLTEKNGLTGKLKMDFLWMAF